MEVWTWLPRKGILHRLWNIKSILCTILNHLLCISCACSPVRQDRRVNLLASYHILSYVKLTAELILLCWLGLPQVLYLCVIHLWPALSLNIPQLPMSYVWLIFIKCFLHANHVSLIRWFLNWLVRQNSNTTYPQFFLFTWQILTTLFAWQSMILAFCNHPFAIINMWQFRFS